jgi:hypothetical protein
VNKRRLEFDVENPILVATPHNVSPIDTSESSASGTPKQVAKKPSVWNKLF